MAVINNGPMDAPIPKQACIQFIVRTERVAET